MTLPSYEEALRDSGHGPVSVSSATTSLGNSGSGRHGQMYESGLTITAPESGHHQTAICGVNDRSLVSGEALVLHEVLLCNRIEEALFLMTSQLASWPMVETLRLVIILVIKQPCF